MNICVWADHGGTTQGRVRNVSQVQLLISERAWFKYSALRIHKPTPYQTLKTPVVFVENCKRCGWESKIFSHNPWPEFCAFYPISESLVNSIWLNSLRFNYTRYCKHQYCFKHFWDSFGIHNCLNLNCIFNQEYFTRAWHDMAKMKKNIYMWGQSECKRTRVFHNYYYIYVCKTFGQNIKIKVLQLDCHYQILLLQ